MSKSDAKTVGDFFGGMRIRALGDRVVVRQDREDERSKGGIIIPEYIRERERPRQGVVLAVGSGKPIPKIVDGKVVGEAGVRPLDVAVGDHVIFGKYCGTTVEKDGDVLMVVREDDIHGVIEED